MLPRAAPQMQLPPKRGPSSGISEAIFLHNLSTSSVAGGQNSGRAPGSPVPCRSPPGKGRGERSSTAHSWDLWWPMDVVSSGLLPWGRARCGMVWGRVDAPPWGTIRPRMPPQGGREVSGEPHDGCPLVPEFSPSPVPTVDTSAPRCPLHHNAPALPGRDHFVF